MKIYNLFAGLVLVALLMAGCSSGVSAEEYESMSAELSSVKEELELLKSEQEQNIEEELIETDATEGESNYPIYDALIDSFSQPNDADHYDAIISIIPTIQDLAYSGRWGNNTVRAFIYYITGKDASDLMGDELVNACDAAVNQAKKYYMDGNEGINTFISDLRNAGYVNTDGSLNLSDLPQAAEDMGMSVDSLCDILLAINDTGFVTITLY